MGTPQPKGTSLLKSGSPRVPSLVHHPTNSSPELEPLLFPWALLQLSPSFWMGGGEGKVFCPWATHFDATPRSSLGRGGDLALDEWSQLCKIWGKRSSRQQGKHVQRPWGVVRHGNPEDQQRKPGVRCGQTTGLTREGGEESGLHSSHSGSTLRRKIWRGPHTGG